MKFKSTKTILIGAPIILTLLTIALGWVLPESLMVVVILPLGLCILLSLVALLLATPKFIVDHLKLNPTLKWFRLFRGLLLLTVLVDMSLTLSLILTDMIEIHVLPLGSTLDILLPVVLMQHIVSVLYFVFILGMIYALLLKQEYREYKFSWLDIVLVLILVLFTADHIHQLVTPHPFFFEDYGI